MTSLNARGSDVQYWWWAGSV